MIAEDLQPTKQAKAGQRPRAAIVSVLMLVFAVGGAFPDDAFGVDPLPPEIERASPEKQKAYIQRVGQDALRERARVAQRRYEERQQNKQALVTSIQRQAEIRRRAILNELSPQTAHGVSLSQDNGSLMWALTGLGLLGVTLGLGALALSRNALAGWLDQAPPPEPRLVTLDELRAIVRQMPEEGTPVDLNPLAESAAGDPRCMNEILDLYLRQTTDRIAGIKAAIDAGSPAVAKGLAHDCAGASVLCGMKQIAPLFQELARVSQDCRMVDLLVLVDRIERAFQRITTCLTSPSVSMDQSPVAGEPGQGQPVLQTTQNGTTTLGSV